MNTGRHVTNVRNFVSDRSPCGESREGVNEGIKEFVTIEGWTKEIKREIFYEAGNTPLL